MVLGPFFDKATGDHILRLQVVHPPGSRKTVMDCGDGETVVVRLRFGGVARVTGHGAQVFNLVIQDLVVRRVRTSGREDDDQTDPVRQFEFLNENGDRLLLIEARQVTVESVH
jgi:hypothetical protein